MRSYTIVRNGVIRRAKRGEHYCGWAHKSVYPYRVIITVNGQLQAPDYFVVANESIDEWIQAYFTRHTLTESCEKMCDTIVDIVLDGMRGLPQWTMEKVHVELTGTNGLALLSCDWIAETVTVG